MQWPSDPVVTGVDGAEMAQTLNNLAASGISGRFKAWWNGDEVEAAAAKGNARAGKVEKVEVEELPSPSGIAEWTPQRIAAIQRLFGEGFDGPASQERARDLVNPIGLNEQMTVLDASARLGSAARTIAKETGAWVDGLEMDELLMEEAVRLSAKAGLAKKAVIRKLELDDHEVKEHKRDAIVIREGLYQISDRERIFKTLCDLLKPSSHLLMTEFLSVPGKGQEERAEWGALHRTSPRLFELDELREGLSKVGFDVRVAKDETKAYKAMLLNGILRFGKTVPKEPVLRELQEWVMWEVEYWARTYNALEAGGITMHRIHAVTPMSDPTKM
ncbi:MAG: methyltransferase domain-containing protein [Rhodospirillaceae bacterium]|nr:methyltransferase domain-containing protein [Rhodospirillaceae bacterium]MBT4690729.1 methyltransferase domain-containing protein [Rhodospirillaceae bacterium]MBT5080108.1 methyltransferase domain-containing protein [Rhodospirillaceae bacterium]MBT7284405.1 methyltransferase domain-containing protein [Rhodospirillaceae bacterium]MBT7976733.1 methyltransferase domain-containing protein [Rhodospirillaceae bacterium]